MQRPHRKERRRRSSSELLAASQNLFYEIEMLHEVAAKLARGDGDQIDRNARVESFTIHARVLRQFFFPSNNPQADDVLANDYFSEQPDWDVLRGELPPALTLVNARVGREIAHLSYGRIGITAEAKQWDVSAIYDALWTLVELFVATAPKALLAFDIRPNAVTVGVEGRPTATNTPTMVNTPTPNAGLRHSLRPTD